MVWRDDRLATIAAATTCTVLALSLAVTYLRRRGSACSTSEPALNMCPTSSSHAPSIRSKKPSLAETLPAEVLVVIAEALADEIRSIGRLCSTCQAVRNAFDDSAFVGALAVLQGTEAGQRRGARDAVRALTSLDSVTWAPVAGRSVSEPPGTHHHAVFVYGTTRESTDGLLTPKQR
eukprot:4112285-Prymnesium_polylepis.1